MTEQLLKKVIVVLSAGRSGTSLLMKGLGALGMRLSENMIPGSVGNPEGFFEDTEIVDVHKELFEKLNTHPVLPLPEGWLESEAAKKARPKIKKILENRLYDTDSIWGFKDPRTVSFLPLWSRILNAPGTVPVFILATRDPATVASSLRRQINREEAITELQWLQRTTDALHHTAADCFIVQYEDWFTRPYEQAEGLLKYTGLDKSFTANLEEAIQNVIKPNLNRAVYDEYQVQNEYVLRLYDVLKDCRGADFDRQRLMAVVKECRKAMDGFKGWYLEAQKYIVDLAQFQENFAKERERKEELKGKLDEERKQLQELEGSRKKAIEELKAKLEKERARGEDLKGKLDEERKQLQELEGSRKKAIEELKAKLEKERARGEDLKGNLEGANKQVQALETDLEAMVLENNRLLKASKDYFDQSEELRKALVAMKNERRRQDVKQQSKDNQVKGKAVIATVKCTQRQISDEQVKKMRQEIIKIRYRYSFRLGKILTDAVLRPGKNTVLMPYYLIILFWDIATGRGRRKMEQVLAEKKLA
jgi:hypothetical protein